MLGLRHLGVVADEGVDVALRAAARVGDDGRLVAERACGDRLGVLAVVEGTRLDGLFQSCQALVKALLMGLSCPPIGRCSASVARLAA